MGKKKVNVEDRMEVYEVCARYCWYVDEGDSEAWADLWTEDGVFAGVTPEPLRGREALKGVPPTSIAGRFQLSLAKANSVSVSMPSAGAASAVRRIDSHQPR